MLLVPRGMLPDAEGCQQGAQRLCGREGAQPYIPAGKLVHAFMHNHACKCVVPLSVDASWIWAEDCCQMHEHAFGCVSARVQTPKGCMHACMHV